jgi:hypothetical protein
VSRAPVQAPIETPLEISPAQIRAFAALYPHDVRPIQPLNGRIVQESRFEARKFSRPMGSHNYYINYGVNRLLYKLF